MRNPCVADSTAEASNFSLRGSTPWRGAMMKLVDTDKIKNKGFDWPFRPVTFDVTECTSENHYD